MKLPIAIILIAVLAALALAAFQARLRLSPAGSERPRRKALLTVREQAMFNRLAGALPQYRVLAQVSFGALLTARSMSARNRFDRKIADFVVCDQALQPLAVIELDDATHAKKLPQDKARDDMLKDAGYNVLRYQNVPDIDQVVRDLLPLRSSP